MIYSACIYGFIEEKDNYIIDYDILSKFDCSYYIEHISFKLKYKSNIYYGIECFFDKVTGKLIISDDEKNKVNELYKLYVEFKKKTDIQFKEPKIEYYCCISGDIDFSNHTNYTFDNNDSDSDLDTDTYVDDDYYKNDNCDFDNNYYYDEIDD